MRRRPQVLVDRLDRDSARPNRGGDPLDRPVPDVAGREAAPPPGWSPGAPPTRTGVCRDHGPAFRGAETWLRSTGVLPRHKAARSCRHRRAPLRHPSQWLTRVCLKHRRRERGYHGRRTRCSPTSVSRRTGEGRRRARVRSRKRRRALCEEPEASLEVKEAIYRIAQEALHNTVRHARANNVTIKMVCEGGRILKLEVSDDGVGFETGGEFPGHLGLRSMRERAQRLGGTLTLESSPGAGTAVRVLIPA